MAGTASWWLKLDRAGHHLKEVNDYLTAYERKDVYRPRRVRGPNDGESEWRYVLEIIEEPDERLPLAIGDMVHNMRTALDHIMIAIRPQAYRYAPGFPILMDDPWQGELTKAKRDARARFDKAVRGLNADAVAAIKLLQPYLDRAEGNNPQRNALGVIARLDNADKHREPIVMVPGIVHERTIVRTRGEELEQRRPRSPSGYPGLADDGAEIAHFRWVKHPPLTEAEVKVDIRGTPLVVLDVGIEDGYMAARDMLGRSLGYFVDHVIPVLEQFLPDRQPERPT